MSEAESFSKKTGRCYIHNSPNCRYCGGFCEVCGVNETKTKCDSCWKLSCNDCIAEVHSGSHGVPWALEKEGHKIVCEKCIEDYYDYVDKYAESFSAEEKDRFAWKRTLREKHDKLPYDATWEETLIVEIMRLRGRLEQRGFDPHAKIGDEKYAESFSAMDDECETCTDPTDPTEDEWCGELCEKCVYDGRTNCKLCCQTGRGRHYQTRRRFAGLLDMGSLIKTEK